MKPVNPALQEFIARFLADLAKAIFAVALASYFFKDFPLWMRLTLGGSFFLFAFSSFFFYPKRQEETP